MTTNKTVLRSTVLAIALAASSLCALAQIVEPPRSAHLGTRSTLATAVTPKAVVAAANVKDVDQPARAPFQATVTVNVNNFVYTPVPIPAGQRLVIETVSINGAAASNNGPLQPIVLLSTAVAGNPAASVYVAPPAPNPGLPSQFYVNQPLTVYADSLEIAPAYAGYTPSYLIMNVVITGHLVSIP